MEPAEYPGSRISISGLEIMSARFRGNSERESTDLVEIDGYDRRDSLLQGLQPEILLQSLIGLELYAENHSKSTTGALLPVYP